MAIKRVIEVTGLNEPVNFRVVWIGPSNQVTNDVGAFTKFVPKDVSKEVYERLLRVKYFVSEEDWNSIKEERDKVTESIQLERENPKVEIPKVESPVLEVIEPMIPDTEEDLDIGNDTLEEVDNN